MIKKTGISAPLSLSLFAAFISANGLILIPFGKSLLPFVFALLLGVIFLPLSLFLFRFLPKEKRNIFITVSAVVLAVLSFLAAGVCAGEYSLFIYKSVLTRANMWVIKLVFAFCVFLLAASKTSAIYKFAFLSAVFSAEVLFVLFFMSAKTFDTKNLSGIFSLNEFSLPVFLKYLLVLIVPTFAAVLFCALTDSGISPLRVLIGTAAGGILSLVVLLDTVLSFGLPLAAKLDYPYIDDISTVTAGSLFTRMDGFAYFAFFAAYILKCAVCVNLAARLTLKNNTKYRRPLIAVLSAALMFFG